MQVPSFKLQVNPDGQHHDCVLKVVELPWQQTALASGQHPNLFEGTLPKSLDQAGGGVVNVK